MVRSKLDISNLIDSKVNLFLVFNWRIWFGNEKFHVWTGSDKKKSVGATFLLFTMFWYRALYFSPTRPAAMQIETKESFNQRKKFNSHRIGLSHQHGRRVDKPIWRTWRLANCCFVIHKSLTTMVVQKVRLSKSILSPDEDPQCTVETSWSIAKWQSCDKR